MKEMKLDDYNAIIYNIGHLTFTIIYHNLQVTFDGSTPRQLLGIVNDVLHYLDPKTHPKSLVDESNEFTVSRMVNFLRLMKVKIPGGNM